MPIGRKARLELAVHDALRAMQRQIGIGIQIQLLLVRPIISTSEESYKRHGSAPPNAYLQVNHRLRGRVSVERNGTHSLSMEVCSSRSFHSQPGVALGFSHFSTRPSLEET